MFHLYVIVVNSAENIPLQVDKEHIFGYYNNIMNEKLLLSTDIIKINHNIDMSEGCVAAVGSFDGVHLGHRHLLSALTSEAKRLSLPAAVFTFNTDDNPKSAPNLATYESKNKLLAMYGADIICSSPFSALRNMPAEEFALDYLYKALGAKTIVCGYDFRFGKDRSGDVNLIKALLSDKGVTVITPDAFVLDGEPVSSTAIRKLIGDGSVDAAKRLLGREFFFEAPVIRGRALGRNLGFPTINQRYPKGLIIPCLGVYAVRVKVCGGIFGGVANIGYQPTVGGEELLCETNIFDFTDDCYGEIAEISFVSFMRKEQRFASLEELKAQIADDKAKARRILLKGDNL